MRTSFVLFASGLAAVAMAQDMVMSALPMPVQQISDGQVQNPAATVVSISAVGGSAAPVGVSSAVTMAAGAATGGLVVATPEGTPVPTFTMLVGNNAANGSSSGVGAAGSQVTSIPGASSSANLLGAAGAASATSSSGVAQVSTAGAAPMATAAGLGFVGLVAALVI